MISKHNIPPSFQNINHQLDTKSKSKQKQIKILSNPIVYEQQIYDFQSICYQILFVIQLYNQKEHLISNPQSISFKSVKFLKYGQVKSLQKWALLRMAELNLRENLKSICRQNIMKIILDFKGILKQDELKQITNELREYKDFFTKEEPIAFQDVVNWAHTLEYNIADQLIKLEALKKKYKLKVHEKKIEIYIQKIIGLLIVKHQQQCIQRSFIYINLQKPEVGQAYTYKSNQVTTQLNFLKQVSLIQKSNIYQDISIDDCYLIASMISIAMSHPKLIQGAFNEYQSEIMINLFMSGKKYRVKTNKELPYRESQNYFSQQQNKQLFPALLQKALACILKRYKLIQKQYNELGLSLLCQGAPVFKYFTKQINFENISEFLEKNYILTCETFQESVDKQLIRSHSYSIIGIVEINKKKILQIRDPYKKQLKIKVHDTQISETLTKRYSKNKSVIFLDHQSYYSNIVSVCIAKYHQTYQVSTFRYYNLNIINQDYKRDIVKLKFKINPSNAGLIFISLYQPDHSRYSTKIYKKSPSSLYLYKKQQPQIKSNKKIINIGSSHQCQIQQKDNHIELNLEEGEYYAIFICHYELIQSQLMFSIYSKQKMTEISLCGYENYELTYFIQAYIKTNNLTGIESIMSELTLLLYVQIKKGIGLIQLMIDNESKGTKKFLDQNKRYQIVTKNNKRVFFLNGNSFTSIQKYYKFYFIPITVVNSQDFTIVQKLN